MSNSKNTNALETSIKELKTLINQGENYEELDVRAYTKNGKFFDFGFEDESLKTVHVYKMDLDKIFGDYADDEEEYRDIPLDEFISGVKNIVTSYEIITL